MKALQILAFEVSMKKRSTLLLLLMVSLSPANAMQDKKGEKKWGQFGLARGTDLTLKIPLDAMSDRGFYYRAVIEQGERGLVVNGHEEWESIGIPSLLLLRPSLMKVIRDSDSQDKNARLATLQLEQPEGPSVLLEFKQNVSDVEAALHALVFFGRPSEAPAQEYRRRALEARAESVFKDQLAFVPRDSR